MTPELETTVTLLHYIFGHADDGFDLEEVEAQKDGVELWEQIEHKVWTTRTMNIMRTLEVDTPGMLSLLQSIGGANKKLALLVTAVLLPKSCTTSSLLSGGLVIPGGRLDASDPLLNP